MGALGRSDASRARIRAGGGSVAESAIDAADGADIVITMLPDSADVPEVVLGEGGLAEELTAGQVYIGMSTILPDLTHCGENGAAGRVRNCSRTAARTALRTWPKPEGPSWAPRSC